MNIVKALNAVLAFGLELAMLAAFARFGYTVASGAMRWVLAIGLPIVVMIMWGIWTAPNSSTRLEQPLLLCFELGIMLVAAYLVWRGGNILLAGIFAGLAVVSQVIALILKQ